MCKPDRRLALAGDRPSQRIWSSRYDEHHAADLQRRVRFYQYACCAYVILKLVRVDKGMESYISIPLLAEVAEISGCPDPLIE